MSTAPQIKKPKYPVRKKIVRFLTIVFLSILFLEFVVYFGSNLLLANWTRIQINQSTKGIYEVDFNRVNFSLIRRGLFLDGIILKPVNAGVDQQDQVLFDLYLDQLAIKSLWYSFSSGIVSIGKIEIDNPNLSMDIPSREQYDNDAAGAFDPQIESRVKALENEIKKSIGRFRFAGVYIHEIEIVHADLFFLNFLSDNSLKAENTKLIVKDINWATRQEWKTPFNAKGFEFELENVNFPLPDGVHTISAISVRVSSLGNKIDLRGVQLTPDRTKASRAYYEVSLKDLRVGNVDLNNAFMTSQVMIDEIVLTNPDFKVERKDSKLRDNTATGDLNELIDGILESIEVKELSVVKGRFLTSDFNDSLKNRIEIAELNFNMIKFYLGKNQAQKTNQFFYGQEASMDIRKASLYLSDDVHVIYGDRVSLSSFKDELLVENLRIEPRADALTNLDLGNIIRLTLPKLSLNSANLKRFYNEGRLEMDELIIESPKVEFTELNEQEKKSFKEGEASELLQGYMDAVVIKRVDLKNGEVQFTDEAGIRSNDIGFESFSLLLEDVLIQPNLNSSIQDIFLANEMVLSLDKYRLKLRDNLHEFLAGKVIIDSKKSLIVIQDFSLRPESPDSLTAVLDNYNKTVVINVKVPEFRIEGIDLKAAFWDEKLMINQILVPAPIVELARFRKKKEQDKSFDQFDSAGEVGDLLASYFSYISIDSVSFSDGRVRYENFSGNRNILLSEDSLSLSLKGFLIERGKLSANDRTFFSDEIDLGLKKYAFSVAGGSYEIGTDRLNYNSKSQTIFIDNLRLFPSKAIQSKIEFEVKLPRVAFQGVDLQSFLFDNKLKLNQLSVDGSQINLNVIRGFESSEKKRNKNLKTGNDLPKSIEEISIQRIDALNSQLAINYVVGENDVQSIKTNFDLGVSGLFLDSSMTTRENFTGLFEDITLKLEDFSFALPDSIHNVKFSSLLVNNKAEETIFSDFQIIPTNTTGYPGIPILSAKVAELGIKHNSLRQIESTGVFDISQLRLKDPVIDLYLDRIEKTAPDKDPSVRKEGELVSSIILRDILIQQGQIIAHTKDYGQMPRLAFNNIDFGMKGLDLNLMNSDQEIRPQFLLEKDLSLSFANYILYTDDSLNKLEVGRIRFLENNLFLEEVSFGTTVGRYNYFKKLGYQSDAIDGTVKRISILDIDFDTYFNLQVLKARKVSLDGMQLDVFRDKRLSRREGIIKPMPQELMKNSPFDMLVDSVTATNAFIRYQEFAARAMIPGSIRFEELNLNMAPFALSKKGNSYPLEKMYLKAQSRLMGEGLIELNSTLFFDAPYPMDMNVAIGEFDLRRINSMVSNGVFVEIVCGKVTDGKWDFKMNEDEAWGKMNLNYSDLKIQLLDTVSMRSGKGKLGLLTFAANTLIKNSNPRKLFNNRITSTIYFERDKAKFIFGGWWRATFSGLQGSVGLGQPKIPKRKKDKEE
jgi:hypothetical protein